MKRILFFFLFLNSVPLFAQQERTNSSYETEARKLLIPNAFTPNNDGINDVFKLVNITNEQLIEFKIFNRWGTILFSTKNAQQGWDGTFKGQPQDVGVYGYFIRIKYTDGIIETYRGTVTLIK